MEKLQQKPDTRKRSFTTEKFNQAFSFDGNAEKYKGHLATLFYDGKTFQKHFFHTKVEAQQFGSSFQIDGEKIKHILIEEEVSEFKKPETKALPPPAFDETGFAG